MNGSESSYSNYAPTLLPIAKACVASLHLQITMVSYECSKQQNKNLS